MKGFLIGFGILVVVVLFFVVSPIIGTYNKLVAQREAGRTEQAQIETQLQRRFDLVPNLVASVKGGMAQEKAVFQAIADARTKYAGTPAGTPEKLQAGSAYEGALSRLLVIIENYPELKSIETVKDLMVQLEGSENRISVARQRYNEAVQVYNQNLQSFPTNIVGRIFGFQQLARFEGANEAKTAPVVNLEK